MACKQCELSRVKGVVVKKCGARNSNCLPEIWQDTAPIECDCGDLEDLQETELLSEITDIDNEEAE
jgi:hypothetical protein